MRTAGCEKRARAVRRPGHWSHNAPRVGAEDVGQDQSRAGHRPPVHSRQTGRLPLQILMPSQSPRGERRAGDAVKLHLDAIGPANKRDRARPAPVKRPPPRQRPPSPTRGRSALPRSASPMKRGLPVTASRLRALFRGLFGHGGRRPHPRGWSGTTTALVFTPGAGVGCGMVRSDPRARLSLDPSSVVVVPSDGDGIMHS